MKTATSVSGGMTSAYVAANYPSDYLVFALVRIEDPKCMYPDPGIRKMVSDKIGAEFIATSEDDLIIKTMLDLEQYLGREITWVTGRTFEKAIEFAGGYLPNLSRRYCTSMLKIEPMFEWWRSLDIDPIIMRVGFRANEGKRATSMQSKCDDDGFLRFKAKIGKTKSGRNRWGEIPWQMPEFPLIDDNIYKIDIQKYWADKPVQFAPHNNCVGCFHRNPAFLRFMFQEHPAKMDWFADQEVKGNWKSVDGKPIPYARIKNMLKQIDLFESDFTACDTGYCELT
jgi:hypothetical protein